MLISEKNKGIDFNVIGYEFPREKKSSKKEFNYDANWLSLKIYYRDGKKEKTYITPCFSENHQWGTKQLYIVFYRAVFIYSHY